MPSFDAFGPGGGSLNGFFSAHDHAGRESRCGIRSWTSSVGGRRERMERSERPNDPNDVYSG
jgi:hypothetical protein